MVPPTEHNDNLSSKFENFEYAPRPQAWDRLEAAAGEQGGGKLASQFEQFQHAPHSRVWRRVEGVLHPGRRRAVLFWWAAAAGIALLLTWTGWQNDWLRPEQSVVELAMEEPPEVNPVPAVLPEVKCQEGESISYADGQLQNASPGQLPLSNDSAKPNLSKGQTNWGEDGGSSNWNRNPGKVEPLPMPMTSNELVERIAPRYRTNLQVNLAEVNIAGRPMLVEKFRADSLDQEEELVAPNSGNKAWAAGLGTNYAPLLASATTEEFSTANDPGPALFNPTPQSAGESLDRGYRENFSPPLILNASIQKQLSKHWAMVMGLVYTQLRSQSETTSGDSRFRYSRRRQYLGLSVAPRYHFFNRKHFSLYSTLGGQYDVGLPGRSRSQDFENDKEVSDLRVELAGGNQALILVGMGMDAALTRRLNLNFQLNISSYIHQSHYNLWSERVNWPAAQIGLNLEI